MRWSYSNRSGESLFLDVALRREKKGREGKKKKGNKEKLRIMHHAILRFLFKKE